METREDLLKLCKYYKGEDDRPEEKDFILWMAEAHLVQRPFDTNNDIERYKKSGLYGKINTGIDLRVESAIWAYSYHVACRVCDYDDPESTAKEIFLERIKKY